MTERISKHERVSVAIPYNQYSRLNGQLYCQSSFSYKQSVVCIGFVGVGTMTLPGNESRLRLSIKNIFHHWNATCITE